MNFDKQIERIGTGAAKWDGRKQLFGKEDVIPMWVADMDFEAPEPVIQALEDRARHGIFGYSVPPKELDESIQKWLLKKHQWDIHTDWIVYSPGVVPSLSLAIQTLTKSGEGVVIQPPVYYPFFDVIKKNDRKLVTNPLRLEANGFRMDLDHLEHLFKQDSSIKLMLLCSPHNPVGRVWDKRELQQLGQLCSTYDVLVLSDEIHFDLVYPGYKHTPFAALSDELAERCVVFSAPSKTFNLAGLHLSYMIAPNPKIREALKQEISRLYLHPLHNFNIVATVTAYQQGEAWLNELLGYLQENAKLVQQRLTKILPQVEITELQGTYLMWLDFRNYFSSYRDLKHWAIHEARVGFSEGAQFGKEGEGYLRMNIACPRSLLKEALDRIEAAAVSLS